MEPLGSEESLVVSLIKVKRFLVIGFVLLALVTVIAGCSSDTSDSGNLNGVWVSAYDKYTVDVSAKTVMYGDDFGSYCVGAIENSPNYEADHGVLIVNFSSLALYGTDYSDLLLPGYGAVYWSELKAGSVKMATALDLITYAPVIFGTIDEAKANFTFDKVNDYIGMWGTYTK